MLGSPSRHAQVELGEVGGHEKEVFLDGEASLMSDEPHTPPIGVARCFVGGSRRKG